MQSVYCAFLTGFVGFLISLYGGIYGSFAIPLSCVLVGCLSLGLTRIYRADSVNPLTSGTVIYLASVFGLATGTYLSEQNENTLLATLSLVGGDRETALRVFGPIGLKHYVDTAISVSATYITYKLEVTTHHTTTEHNNNRRRRQSMRGALRRVVSRRVTSCRVTTDSGAVTSSTTTAARQTPAPIRATAANAVSRATTSPTHHLAA